MDPSRRTLSAAFVVLFLVTASEMIAPAQAYKCTRLSANFHGWCFDDRHCNRVCLGEGNGNTGGECGTNELKCYCIYDCSRAPVPAASPDAANQNAGSITGHE
ncbi:hypothetical protein EJB05_48169 [Eragrostis curvula]|uniref:Knottins-like domain-containing protein n=1 Tax=Eragrostis curvula TaxID=38414 RepID=A0A5J9T2D7_9POAL|nr:hypothetical protein EJB05_48169 [Eragrostis curvula]